MKPKTFVLDTNVLLHDPEAVTKFPLNNVVIPLTVLEELDTMKRLHNELGRNSREVFRLIDGLKGKHEGDWHSGVQIANQSKLWIQLDIKRDFDPNFALEVNDNKIIMAAYLLKEKGERVVFVSKDFAARIKAEAVGLEAEDYENLKVPYAEIYRGYASYTVEKARVDTFFKDGQLSHDNGDWLHNQYVVMSSPENSSALARYDARRGFLESLMDIPDIWGVRARNMEQHFALDVLMRDEIPLVTLVGPAGTGKTLLALAVALRKVFDEDAYNRILISRPVIPLGKDIGYLPGSKEEKLESWMQPIFDNLAFLCDSYQDEPNETLRWVTNSNKLEMEAVTYIRGRSLPRLYMIIDEAQNLTPHEVKTIISRAGEGTKVILCGDPSQIDHPYLDSDSNGLTYTVDRFKGKDLHGHVYLSKTERSALAAMATELL